MDLIVQAENIRLEYLGRDVLDIDEVALYGYDRIGLVGPNGAGKTTLLRVLMGEVIVPGATVRRHGELAYLPQLEDVRLEAEDADPALLGRLGVMEALPRETISGGEETRLKIARMLSGDVHGLLADEPTCHLDRAGIDFLAGQLRAYDGALLLISHDRELLDQTVDKIWALEDGKITEYWGNYSDYLRQREEAFESQTAAYAQQQAELARLAAAATDKRRQAKALDKPTRLLTQRERSNDPGRLQSGRGPGGKQKAMHTAAKAIEARASQMDTIERPQAQRTIRFRKSEALALHNPFPIIAEGVRKQFGDRVLFEDVAFQIPLGKKVAITGPNGTGKTTLLEMILRGEDGITVSTKAVIGYFAQNGYKMGRDQGVMPYMQQESEYTVGEIRSVLASMGLTQADIRKDLSMLSGGEMIKLLLAKMLLGRYNILLMDEPSNFLDLPSVEALEALMRDYLGTIVFVSHDKRLVENVADMVYILDEGRLHLQA